MKTAIISTCWLDNNDYLQKTAKFIKYYTKPEIMAHMRYKPSDVWFVDNASSQEAHNNLKALIGEELYNKINFKRYSKHYKRTAHLEYPYCWRALYFARELFQEHDYDKVIFTNNDSYIVSSKFAKQIANFQSGYLTPYCKKHSFPECEIQIITRDDAGYWEMTGKNYLDYNGLHMELVIPSTVDYNIVGDRHSEYGLKDVPESVDFSTQVPLEMEIVYK